jgi:hypothetical protein
MVPGREFSMPFDATLATRVRKILGRRANFSGKRLFGGVGFLLSGNLCAAVWKEWLILRLGPDQAEAALREPFVKEFDVTGRPMRGWAMVDPGGLEGDDDVRRWCDAAIRFVKTLPAK